MVKLVEKVEFFSLTCLYLSVHCVKLKQKLPFSSMIFMEIYAKKIARIVYLSVFANKLKSGKRKYKTIQT